MYHVCWRCGAFAADKEILPDPAYPEGGHGLAICPACGHAHPFRRWPLLIVGGASGSGKTTLLHRMLQERSARRGPAALLLEADILWQPALDTPQDNYRAFCQSWVRLALNLGQQGPPVVIWVFLTSFLFSATSSPRESHSIRPWTALASAGTQSPEWSPFGRNLCRIEYPAGSAGDRWIGGNPAGRDGDCAQPRVKADEQAEYSRL